MRKRTANAISDSGRPLAQMSSKRATMRQPHLPGLTLALLLGIIYLLSYSGLFHSVDEQSLLAMTETALTGEGWHVNQMEWEQAWNPPQSAPGPDGNLYVYKRGFLLSILALPFFALGKGWPGAGAVGMALLIGPLISAATAYLLYRLLRRTDLSPRGAALGVLAWGLGTLALPYARMLFTEPMAAFSIVLALDALVAWRQERRLRWLPLAGIGLGLLFINKLANVIVVPFFGFYFIAVLWQDRHSAHALRTFIHSGLAFALPIVGGFLLLIAYNIASFGVPLAAPFSGVEGFTTPILSGLNGLLFSPGKGLLWYVPLAWLVIPGFIVGWRTGIHRAERLLALGIFLALLLLYAAWFDWAGGRSWGPRFLVPALPLLIVLIAPLLAWDQPRIARIGVAALLILSVLAQLPGVLTNVSVEEGRQLAAGISLDQLYWDWRHSPLWVSWSAISGGRLEPLILQPFFWQRGPWLVLASAALAISLTLLGMRSRRRLWLPAILSAALSAAILALSLPIAANGDPRWHETSSEPAENEAIWSLLAATAQPDDILVLDLLPYFDILGRTSIWMDQAPAPPSYIGWSRKDELDAADQERLARWLSPYARVWLSLQGTPPGSDESTTERWLDRWGYRGSERWFGGQRLVEYGVPVEDDPLWRAGPVRSPSITLAEVAVRQGRGSSIRLVDLRWNSISSPDLRFSLQLLDAEGRLVKQIDRTPAGARRGNDLLDRVAMTLPPGEFTLILKLYDAISGSTIPWHGEDGHVDWLILEAHAR
ncbi:MAG: phospholipid carrier-dependent glycosyltransferase [Caldilineaceae bacterium]|nr:phospholipid carrier-dependent glycosyltransferase [Caldilineaceae bacterium]